MNIDDPNIGNVPMHYTFNTPVGAPPANQCGRVLFDDFHVEAVTTGHRQRRADDGVDFPTECTGGAMTPQEKLLEFMIFDLGSCVTPDVPDLHPDDLRRAGHPVRPGRRRLRQPHPRGCGTCPRRQTCGGGGMPERVRRTRRAPRTTCAAQGIKCGPAGDGCGNTARVRDLPHGPDLRRRRHAGRLRHRHLHAEDLRRAGHRTAARPATAAAARSAAAPARPRRPAAAAASPASAASVVRPEDLRRSSATTAARPATAAATSSTAAPAPPRRPAAAAARPASAGATSPEVVGGAGSRPVTRGCVTVTGSSSRRTSRDQDKGQSPHQETPTVLDKTQSPLQGTLGPVDKT